MKKLTNEIIDELKQEAKRLEIEGYKEMSNEDLLTAVADAQVDEFTSRYDKV